MHRGMSESLAHTLATDRKWDDVMKLSPRELGEIVDRVEDAAIIIWLKIGGLAVKFDKGVDDEVFLFPKFMGDANREPVYKYNFKTGVVTFIGEGDDDPYIGLSSLFGDDSITEWFSPHIDADGGFVFNNVPFDATEEQEENLNSFFKMGVMKSILNTIENNLYFTAGYRQSINRLDVINFLVRENPLLDDEEEEEEEEDDGGNDTRYHEGLGSLFG